MLMVSPSTYAIENSTVAPGHYSDVKVIASDASGLPLSLGHVEVYSFTEQKVVDTFTLDHNGVGYFSYCEPANVIAKSKNKRGDHTIQYMLVFMKDGELSTETYIKSFGQPEDNSFHFTKKLQPPTHSEIVTRTSPHETKPSRSTGDHNSIQSVGVIAPNGVISSKSLGIQPVNFAQVSSAEGCKVNAAITSGTELTITGNAIVGGAIQSSSTTTEASPTLTSQRGEIIVFSTNYSFVEEKHRYTHGGDVYEFYRLRATDWESGIDWTRRYKSANNVSFSSISDKPYVIHREGGSTTVSTSNTYSFGGTFGGSLKGPLSGNSYSLGITYKTTDKTALKRTYAGGDYAEYGSGDILIERAIIKK